jgi:uncharacterized protein
MAHIPHEIDDEFPELADRIGLLKSSDSHFARLIEAYNQINLQVHRAETYIEPTDALHETEMRRQRVALKDAIWGMLSAKA